MLFIQSVFTRGSTTPESILVPDRKMVDVDARIVKQLSVHKDIHALSLSNICALVTHHTLTKAVHPPRSSAAWLSPFRLIIERILWIVPRHLFRDDLHELLFGRMRTYPQRQRYRTNVFALASSTLPLICYIQNLYHRLLGLREATLPSSWYGVATAYNIRTLFCFAMLLNGWHWCSVSMIHTTSFNARCWSYVIASTFVCIP